jgi:hypothetical protein
VSFHILLEFASSLSPLETMEECGHAPVWSMGHGCSLCRQEAQDRAFAQWEQDVTARYLRALEAAAQGRTVTWDSLRYGTADEQMEAYLREECPSNSALRHGQADWLRVPPFQPDEDALRLIRNDAGAGILRVFD